MLNIEPLRASSSIALCGALAGVFLLNAPVSAQFRRNASNDIVVYADANFRGASQALRENTADIRPYGLNDKVSSIEIPAGQTWEVCQDINYGAGCQTLTASVADLRTIGWNDRISSLRRIDDGFRNDGFRNGGNRNGGDRNPGFRDNQPGGSSSQPRASEGLIFYDGIGYRGASTVISGDGNNAGAIGNRRTRSVEVHSGTWQLCDRTGRCATVSQSVPDLSQLGLNGQITSVRPVNNYQGGPRRDPRGR